MPQKMSVITRTRDRLPFLKRCRASLEQAAIDHMEWIVVDDSPGGSEGLDAFLDENPLGRVETRVVRAGTENRSKAANAGLAAATGKLVHLFDDDDTVAPDFYEKTEAFLEANPRYGAVATLSEKVMERIAADGTISEISRKAHYPETRLISLAKFGVVQSFAPISFVARREAIDKAGGFDESFDVCEDYEFYLRFLTHFDIGVLPEILCAFHNRDEASAAVPSWRNSSATSDPKLEVALFRNEMLRRDLRKGEMGLGWLLALGELNQGSWRLDLVFDSLRQWRLPNALFRRLRSKA